LGTATTLVVLLTLPQLNPLSTRQYYLIATGLVTSLVNLLYLEPLTSKLMFERYRYENGEKDDKTNEKVAQLRKSFGKLHGISSLMNLINLLAAIAHGFWLAMRLLPV